MKKKNFKSIILIALFTCCFAIIFSGCNIFKEVSNLLNTKVEYDFSEDSAYNSFAYCCATAGLSMYVDSKIKGTDQITNIDASNQTIEEQQIAQMKNITKNYGLFFENFLSKDRFVYDDVENTDAKTSFKNSMAINLKFFFNTECNFKLNYSVTKNLDEKDRDNDRVILSQYGGTILIDDNSNTMIIGVSGYVFSKNNIISTEITIDYKTVNKIKVTHNISEENQPYDYEYSKLDTLLKKISIKENINDEKEIESLSVSTIENNATSNITVKTKDTNPNKLYLEVEKTEIIPTFNFQIFQLVDKGITKYRIDQDFDNIGVADRFIIPKIAE